MAPGVPGRGGTLPEDVCSARPGPGRVRSGFGLLRAVQQLGPGQAPAEADLGHRSRKCGAGELPAVFHLPLSDPGDRVGKARSHDLTAATLSASARLCAPPCRRGAHVGSALPRRRNGWGSWGQRPPPALHAAERTGSRRHAAGRRDSGPRTAHHPDGCVGGRLQLAGTVPGPC